MGPVCEWCFDSDADRPGRVQRWDRVRRCLVWARCTHCDGTGHTSEIGASEAKAS